MVVGPDAALIPLIAAAITKGALPQSMSPTDAASTLALLTGLTCLCAGLLRAGFLTDLFSKPLQAGYTHGIALTVAVSQVGQICEFPLSSANFIDNAKTIFLSAVHHRANEASLALGMFCLTLITLLRRVAPRAPAVLLSLAITGYGATLFPSARALPRVAAIAHAIGLPTIPRMSLSALPQLLATSCGIALITLADTGVVTKIHSHGKADTPTANREMMALGIANITSALFGGFPVSVSATRTPVAIAAGSRTQLTAIVSAATTLALAWLSPNLITNLPKTLLAAVVLDASFRTLHIHSLRARTGRKHSDTAVAIIAMFSIATLGVLAGIAVAVTATILSFFSRTWRPHYAILGRVPGLKGYHDTTRYINARQIPGLLLFRWDAPLFFANSNYFRKRVLIAFEEAATQPKRVVICSEPITDIDSTAAEVLESVRNDLASRGAQLAFCGMKDHIKDVLKSNGSYSTLGDLNFYPTTGVAVRSFVDDFQAPWHDWEETQ